jgi:HAD superfamily hydrolase (TIGR01509 family)
MTVLPPGIAAIAWDIDGTLIDSEPLHHRALVAASRSFGTDLSDLPDMAFRGVHMLQVWEILRPRLPPDLTRADWLAAIEQAYVAGSGTLVPVAGAVEAVRALAARGIRQVAVSNSSRRVVDANIAALGIATLLEFSISLDDVARGKPDPEPYALAAHRLGLPPARIAAVEDSAAGLASARAAGLHGIHLLPEGEAPGAEGPHLRRLIDLAA